MSVDIIMSRLSRETHMKFKNAILGVSLAAICSSNAVVFATEFTGKAKEELAKFQGSWVLESSEKVPMGLR
jgi:hypothetical protein